MNVPIIPLPETTVAIQQLNAIARMGASAFAVPRDQLLAQYDAAGAAAIANTLLQIWKPRTGTPTTAELLAASGTNAVAMFAEHAAKVGEYWADAPRKALLITACKNVGITVTTDANGAPVFDCIKPYTENADGSITLR